MRSSIFAALCVVLAFSTIVEAQEPDTQAPPETLWSGAYLGLHLGVGTADFEGVFDSAEINGPRDNEEVVLAEFFDLDSGAAGIHIGYNFVRGPWLFGIEGDWSRFRASDRLFDPEDEGINGSTTDSAAVDLNWLASLRGRFGYKSAYSLLFVTVGAAWVNGDYTARDDDNPFSGGVVSATTDVSAVGIVLGGGIEHAATNRISVRIETLYYSFSKTVDTSNLTFDSDPGDFAKIDDVLIARIGASYRLGGPTRHDPGSMVSWERASWSGVYLGGHAGYGEMNFDSIFDNDSIANPFDNESSVLGKFFDLGGAVGGIHIGFNRTMGQLLYGIEADWTAVNRSDELFDPGAAAVNGDSASVEIDWLASLRGRLGWVSANTVFYATAGVAWIQGEYVARDNNTFEGSLDMNDFGFVAGGGLEHALSDKWSLRLEGLHYEFSNRKDASTLTPDSGAGDFAAIGDTTVFRIGFNYKVFGTSRDRP